MPAPHAPPTPADPAVLVAAALAAGGVSAALAALNALTPFRYTAMYRFDATHARNLHFFDRENPAAPDPGDDIPLTATYCVYVRRGDRPFVLADALADMRAEGHPAQKAVQAYCGVPVRDAGGRTVGSMCHFDHDPVADPDTVVTLTEAVATLLAAGRLS